jgi:hypothetical protein
MSQNQPTNERSQKLATEPEFGHLFEPGFFAGELGCNRTKAEASSDGLKLRNGVLKVRLCKGWSTRFLPR